MLEVNGSTHLFAKKSSGTRMTQIEKSSKSPNLNFQAFFPFRATAKGDAAPAEAEPLLG